MEIKELTLQLENAIQELHQQNEKNPVLDQKLITEKENFLKEIVLKLSS